MMFDSNTIFVNFEILTEILNLLFLKTDNLKDVLPFVFSSKTAHICFQSTARHSLTVSTSTISFASKSLSFDPEKLGLTILRSAILHAPKIQIDGFVPTNFEEIFIQRKEPVCLEYVGPVRHKLALSKHSIVSSIKLHKFDEKVHQLFAECQHVQCVEIALGYRLKRLVLPAVKNLTLEVSMPLYQYRQSLLKSISVATHSLTIKNANPRVVVPLSHFADFFSQSFYQFTIKLEFHKNYYSGLGDDNFVCLASRFPDDIYLLLKESTNTENRVHVLYRWNMLNRSNKVALTSNYGQRLETILKPKGYKQIVCKEPFGIAFKASLSDHVDCTIVIICYYEYSEDGSSKS